MMQMRQETGIGQEDLESRVTSRVLPFSTQFNIYPMAAKSTLDGVVQTDGTPGGEEDKRNIPDLERYLQSYLSTEGPGLQAYMGRRIHLDWIASDNLGEDTVAAILKGEDDKGRSVNVFIGHRKFDRQVKKIQHGYGLKNAEEATLYVLSHEMVHAMGILSEVETERTLSHYFMEQAHKYYKMSDKAPHPRLQDEYLKRARMYKRLAKTAQYRVNLGEEALRGRPHYHKGHDKHEDHGKHQHEEHGHENGHGHSGGHDSHKEHGHGSHEQEHDDNYSTGKDHWTRKNAPHGEGHGHSKSHGGQGGHDKHEKGDHGHQAPKGKAHGGHEKGHDKHVGQRGRHGGGHHMYAGRSYTPSYQRGSGSYQARSAQGGQKSYAGNAKK